MIDVDLPATWGENPKSGKIGEFVFLIVDVIDSSTLFVEDMTDHKLLENAAALNAVYMHVRKCLGDLPVESEWEWNWAGDGGVFAFPTTEPNTDVRVFECAKEIAALPPYERKNGEKLQLQLRLVLDRGHAYFLTHKGLRRSAALNRASKLRVHGERTSLVVMEEVRKKLPDQDRQENVVRATFVGPHRHEKVYAFVPLMRKALTEEISKARSENRTAQAAHLCYRLGTLNLGVGEGDAAALAFQEAMDSLDDIVPKHRFYYRTLREFYRLWKIVAQDAGPELLAHAEGHDWQKMMQSGQDWTEFIVRHPPSGAWQLLQQVEVITEQMEILAGQPVNEPVGLTSLEVCLLLERFGIPRTWYGMALFDRLNRIRTEMQENSGHSVDGDCSICTGVAASCLILDRRQGDAAALLQWLRSLHGDDYRHRAQDPFANAGPSDHSVHYTAAVLQAFVDHSAESDEEHIRRALAVFFRDEDFKSGEFPRPWREHRNIGIYDFASYVFPTFVRYLLAGRTLEEPEAKILKQTLQALAGQVERDGFEAFLHITQRGRIYGARENVGSFALGALLGLSDEVFTKVLAFNLERFSHYAASARTEAQRQRALDSSIDRARKMIDGWLLQFECALYLRENGRAIPEVVTKWLGVGAEMPIDGER